MPYLFGRSASNSDDMPFLDMNAKRELIKLRESRGMSPERLAAAIAESAMGQDTPWCGRGTVDAYTIRRAERGLVPSIRVRFVMAAFYGVDRDRIWQQDAWVKVDADRKPVLA